MLEASECRGSADRELHEFAEDVYAYIGTKPWQTMLDTERFVLKHSDTEDATGGIATRIRLNASFEQGVQDVKSWFVARGRHAFFWMVGPSATPGDFLQRLLELGAVPVETAACMLLRIEPPPVATSYTIRPLVSLAEHEERVDVDAVASGWDEPQRDAAKRAVREHYADLDPSRGEIFGAFADERLIAFGAARYTRLAVFLDGAVTLPEARGSGAYRALVRARWDEAVRRRTPALLPDTRRWVFVTDDLMAHHAEHSLKIYPP
jgi:hypothetical protein